MIAERILDELCDNVRLEKKWSGQGLQAESAMQAEIRLQGQAIA